MHLDFKLKNAIIVNGKNGKPIVKLIDFGASRYTNSNNNLKNISSSVDKPADLYTAKYCAPEVYRKQEVRFILMNFHIIIIISENLNKNEKCCLKRSSQ
jgi:serine/threonine protein kinase